MSPIVIPIGHEISFRDSAIHFESIEQVCVFFFRKMRQEIYDRANAFYKLDFT